MADDELGVSRRGLLAAGAGAAVGGGAGVLYFGDVLGGGGGGDDGPEQISAQEPDGDDEATLGELRYLIESWDEAQYTVEVTSFTYSEGTVDLQYTSAAADQSGNERWRTHLGEVNHVLWSYAQYVHNNDPNLSWPPGSDGGGSDATTAAGTATTASRPTTVARETLAADARTALRILVSVENPYTVSEDSGTPEQQGSYGVERQWIGNWLVGAWTQQDLLNQVVQSRVGTDSERV